MSMAGLIEGPRSNIRSVERIFVSPVRRSISTSVAAAPNVSYMRSLMGGRYMAMADDSNAGMGTPLKDSVTMVAQLRDPALAAFLRPVAMRVARVVTASSTAKQHASVVVDPPAPGAFGRFSVVKSANRTSAMVGAAPSMRLNVAHATWPTLVCRPWPISDPPVAMVTVPSFMRSTLATWPGRRNIPYLAGVAATPRLRYL
mmetsp:Transcript_57971/g.136633  ORF Transcript_57971/g.136633 Transcript_57971/m.136633 type:complete len:201 (-) Transcript_57971:677-1279(-)